jgi:hypothetical protein
MDVGRNSLGRLQKVWRRCLAFHIHRAIESKRSFSSIGHLKNGRDSSDAAKLPPNDSASFPFRFIDVHARAARDRYREQFFEVPLSLRPKPRALSPQPLLNHFQPVPESAIYGADFSWRDSSRGDVGQYSALKHCDLV